MKNYLLITISSYRDSAQFKLHRSVLWGLAGGVIALFSALAWNHTQLQQALVSQVTQAHVATQTQSEIQQLSEEKSALSSSLQQNQDQLQVLTSRLGELELLAGTEGAELAQNVSQRIVSAEQRLLDKQLLLSKIPNGDPIEYWRVSSKYGVRIHPITKHRHSHIGMDLRANSGTPIFATADGFVEVSRSNYDKGYGNMVTLRHQMGFSTRYAHMSKVLVKYGQYVHKGEQIGLCGSSGDSTAPHLHYELRFLGRAIDPAPFLKLSLATFDQVIKDVRTVPWDSFQQEIKLVSQRQAPPSLQQGHASRVPLNSAVTFMSMAK